MDRKQLKALIAVAEHKSFSSAARALGTVQSNVSAHIARLERDMGVTLIDRATNKPTETKPENINVSIDFDGQVYWNESAIGGEDLLQFILTEAVKDPQPEVHIRADKRVRYEYVATVLFALQRGGMRKVGFISEPVRGEVSQ